MGITATMGMDIAIVGFLRAFYTLFCSDEGQRGMTREGIKSFLRGETHGSLPFGFEVRGEKLTPAVLRMLAQVSGYVESDAQTGESTFRNFAFASLMLWAAPDGNTKAQQVVMFKIMD